MTSTVKMVAVMVSTIMSRFRWSASRPAPWWSCPLTADRRAPGSWCAVHVRPAGDGGRGAVDRADGNGGDNLLEEGVPAFQRAAVARVVAGVADIVPPVRDIPPARRRERATKLLDGQR